MKNDSAITYSKETDSTSVATDLADTVLAKQKIEESEQKYRSLFDSMNQGFCVVEMIFDEHNIPLDYRFMEINPVFEKQTGLKNAIGKTALELVPNLEKRWFELYGNIALTGEPAHFVEGSEAMDRWFDVYAFRIGGDTSRKVALLFSDITERRKAEEVVRKSEHSLRNIILQAPIAMCILRGENFVIDVANLKMFELWGIAPQGMLNKPFFEAVPEAKNEGYEELLTSVLVTGKPFTGREQTVSLPRNGKVETVFIDFSYEPVRELDGTISGIMAMVIDITLQVLARKKIEEVVTQRTSELAGANEALKLANKELQRSNTYLEEFAHAASHDLKEPIRKIQFFTERLKIQLANKLSVEDESIFKRVEHATERMNALIYDLLLYSHVSQRPHETEAINLNEKLKKVMEDLEVEIQEKNAIIRIDTLPIVNGYRRQLQQLFQNLLSNALKYSRVNQAPEITLTSEIVNGGEAGLPVENQYHLITVTDNGIGFEQDQSEKIFQMFQRLHGRGEYSGTGIGLSIVKKVAENHKGTVIAESSPGMGAKFKIYLSVD